MIGSTPVTVTEPKSPRFRTDGRKSLLLYMDAALIKELKRAALDDDTTSYEIVEEASRSGSPAAPRRPARNDVLVRQPPWQWNLTMLQTVRDACQFDPKAIDYALSEQIESLEDLVGHEPGAAEAFFAKTYVTGGMRTLLRQGLQRLAGSLGQAVFEMKQAMGGGKTALDARPGLPVGKSGADNLVPPEITDGFKPMKARVVAISGRIVSRDKHLWGDVAEQLGKADQFAEFFKGSAEGAEREGLESRSSATSPP